MLLSMDTLDLSLVAPDELRLFSVDEYEQMVEHGILGEADGVELLRGVLVRKGRPTLHDVRVEWVDNKFVLARDGSFGARSISREEYDRMVEVGILGKDDKCELLRGAIVTMSPQGWIHGEVIVWLNQKLARALDPATFSVRPCLPFVADGKSEPEPDLAVARRDPTRRAHPSDALLVIEVSVSSLRKDRKLKQILYAESGVPEYWVIDAKRAQVEVFTGPATGGYRKRERFGDGDVLRPVMLPGIELALAELPR